jgi:phosphotransferase system HPr-like phosphotransfer protein
MAEYTCYTTVGHRFHSRPCAEIVLTARYLNSSYSDCGNIEVEITNLDNNHKAKAKSITELISLELLKQGNVEIHVLGENHTEEQLKKCADEIADIISNEDEKYDIKFAGFL